MELIARFRAVFAQAPTKRATARSSRALTSPNARGRKKGGQMRILGARCLFKVGMKKERKTGNPAAKRAFPRFFGPLNFGFPIPTNPLRPTRPYRNPPDLTPTDSTPPAQPNKTHKAPPTRPARPNHKYVSSVPRSGVRLTWLLTPKADYDSSEP